MELLVVLGIISIPLAMTLPNAISVAPVRKTALYEVKGFLEYARSEAAARDRDVYVAFANANAPGIDAPFRAYAAFVATGEERDGLIADQEISQISNWKRLPQGAVFVTGLEFATIEGARLRTVQDSKYLRNFPHRKPARSTKSGAAETPFASAARNTHPLTSPGPGQASLLICSKWKIRELI